MYVIIPKKFVLVLNKGEIFSGITLCRKKLWILEYISKQGCLHPYSISSEVDNTKDKPGLEKLKGRPRDMFFFEVNL